MKGTFFALSATGLALLLFSTVGNSQNPPGPSVDRVGYPTGYQNWTLLYVFDRPDNKQVRTIYGNDAAAGTTANQLFNYSYGSIMVMEIQAALKDAATNPILDSKGRFQKDPTATPTLFVMRKERGFGTEYGPNRNGEWEYVAYRPDGTLSTTPQNSFSCAVCHLQATQARDWTMRFGLRLAPATGAVPDGVALNYKFIPPVITVKKGTNTVTIYNSDVTVHTLADDNPAPWGPVSIPAGGSITISLPPNQTGDFRYHCTLHANMSGVISVQ